MVVVIVVNPRGRYQARSFQLKFGAGLDPCGVLESFEEDEATNLEQTSCTILSSITRGSVFRAPIDLFLFRLYQPSLGTRGPSFHIIMYYLQATQHDAS